MKSYLAIDVGYSPNLHAQLFRLSEFLSLECAAPDWNAILIAEGLYVEPNLKVRVSANSVWTPDAYAERFSQQARAGYDWINLRAIGILHSTLITSIVAPRAPIGVPRTTVIISGPPGFICETPGWSLENHLLIGGV